MATTDNLPVEIGTHRYVVDLKGIQYRPLNSIRQMQDLSREPSDATFDNQGVWKRTQSDFILGAGQNYLDQEDEADRRRFRKSLGIDVWDRRQLTLLPTTELSSSFTSASVTSAISTTAGVYFAGWDEQKFWNGSTWTACTGMAEVTWGMCVIGDYVYAAGSNDVYRVAVGATAWSVFSTENAVAIGDGGGRLVIGVQHSLKELDNAGTATTIYDHFDTNFNWEHIVSAPNGIYCVGKDSSRSSVYMLTVADATGALTPPFPVLQMPDNEFIQDMLYFNGVMIIATNFGFRMATIGSSGFLTSGPLVVIDRGVECLATDGVDVWFGWSVDSSSNTGLGRMRPSRFTDTLVPAYATDIMSPVTGPAFTESIAIYGGKLFFMVNAGGGQSGVYVETTTKVASGQLWTGAITYGTPERKAVHSIEGFWDALPAGSSVSLDVLEGLAGSALPGGVTNTTTASKTERGALTTTYEGEEVEVLITLTRATDTTAAPTLRRWTLRSMPMPYRTFEIVLPIKLQSAVRHQAGGHDQTVHFDPLVEFEYLLGLVQDRSTVTLTMGGRSETVVVDSISIGPDVESVGAVDWTKLQNWIEGVWALRLLTLEPSA